MPLRPLDQADLAAIPAFLAKRAPTRCPATGRGEPLLFVQSVEILARDPTLARRALEQQERLRRERAALHLMLD